MTKENETVYYFLQNYELNELEVESVLSVDGRKEVTFKKVNTDEGGN
jgi:hypothetical protein